MKKILKILLKSVLLLLIIAGAGIMYLTITDYKPEKIEPIEISRNVTLSLDPTQDFKVMSWNIGYGGLNDQENFFMDGGKNARPPSKESVEENMMGILDTLEGNMVDFVMIQEIDLDSKRSYYVNELDILADLYKDYSYGFAKNYDVKYVPVPMPPLGKVIAGQATFSKYRIAEAKRYGMESSYSWPKNTVMLDRCFNTTELEIEGREGRLILMNAHFSAYDDGTLRAKQLAEVKDYISKSYAEGHYIVLGGDWNQTFEFLDTSKYPLYKNGELYEPSVIPSDWMPSDWTYGIADNAPTYRLLNDAYVQGDTQVGVIDGFIVSPNIELINKEVMDLKFRDTDHNPVLMEFRLK